MNNSVYDTVVKIGSMALVHSKDGDLDYNILSRLSKALKPGMLLVSSGATEIGRLDYINRNGQEAKGDVEDIKTDYSAQGQTILIKNYRRFINPSYSVRQLLVEHSHFNDDEKRDHILKFLLRAPEQNAIPIVNYNDPVSSDENRRMELKALGSNGQRVVECVDNDETASIIAMLVKARKLVILTSVNGIYRVRGDESTIIREISGSTHEELEANVNEAISFCSGASRQGANGAAAKLKFTLGPAKLGTHVYISSAENRIADILDGTAPSTHIYLKS